MSQPSPDARAVVRALDTLTTQVRRIADTLTTTADAPSDDDATTPTTATDAPVIGTARIAPWVPELPGAAEHRTRLSRLLDAVTHSGPGYDLTPDPAPAGDEDALRTTRRNSLLNLLDRLDRTRTLTGEERTLLRQHVEAEIRDADTARRNAELADAVTAETKRLKERRTTTLRERAKRAEAALKRVRALHTRVTVRTTSGPAEACDSCENDAMSHPWPCPTAEALDGPTETEN